MSAEMARAGLRAPVNVTWEITLKCNLRCAHCLSAAGTPAENELTPGESLALVDQLKGMGVFQVNIGGGEPFIRKSFPDLLAHCHEKGLVTCVSTNGMLMDDDLARRLGRLKMLYLQVSLDGATAHVNDPIRGRGPMTGLWKPWRALPVTRCGSASIRSSPGPTISNWRI